MNNSVSKAVARKYGFDKYNEILQTYKTVDISKDTDFQKLFNDYFKVLLRSKDWYSGYYEFFQNNKENSSLTYNEIIDYCYKNLSLKNKSHPVEASFSSKMLAVINPKMPILDKQVLANMGLGKITGETQDEKLRDAKEKYAEICRRYNRYLDTDDCNSAIELFNTIFPDYTGFTDTKKIDWFLWALSREELESIGKFGVLINEQT